MNYKKMYFELRKKIMEKLKKEGGDFNYVKDVYRDILFLILETESKDTSDENVYEKIWYLARLNLSENAKLSNFNRDTFKEMLFLMLDIEHTEKGILAHNTNKGE